MRVLLTTQYYHPEPVEKVHDLARGLVRLGHEVEVVTGFPCYPIGRIYSGYRQRIVQKEVIDGVTVIRVPQMPDHSQRAWRRILYYLSFAASAALLGGWFSRKPDVILVYQAALPIGLTGWFLRVCKRAPVVLDVVDLWPESMTASGMLQSRWAERVVTRVAKFVYDRADHVSVVTEGFRCNLIAMGVPERKLSVIHNWMPSETYQSVAPDPELAAREGLAHRFNVMYAGNMGPLQNLSTVLDCAERLRDITEIQFVLVGNGLEFDALVAAASARQLTNVRFLGRRPPEAMPALYALADVLLVHLKPEPLSDLSIPSKVFAYMTVGLPMIVAVRGTAETFVRDHGIGLAVPPSNPEAMANAVRRLFTAEPAERKRIGDETVAAYRQKFCSEVQIRRMSALLESVVMRQHPRRSENLPGPGAA